MDLIPILRQAEILQRDSNSIRSKKERSLVEWKRLHAIKKTTIWKEFINLDNEITHLIKKKEFTDEQKFKRWRELQIGIQDFIALAFTFDWVWSALKEAGYSYWGEFYNAELK